MAITASSVIKQAAQIAQDATTIRWPVADWVSFLNAGQREIMLHRPDAFNKTATITCEAGTKQKLPADGVKLIDVQRNIGANKAAIRLADREILDAQMPGWHGMPATANIQHFMYDPREPKAFWVYPPATTAAQIEINYSATPVVIDAPADNLIASVTGNIAVADVFATALEDFMLYRAYLKDAEYAGNMARAQSHYAAFATSLGIEIKGTLAVQPTSRGNPNARGAAAVAGAAAATKVG